MIAAESASARGPAPRARRRGVVALALGLFAMALAVRLSFLFYWHSGDKIIGKDAWSWGYEAACMARSIAAGEGWAGQWNRAQMPWGLGSGASGWLPPVYPGLIALLMRCLGGLTPAMATALLVIQAILSALTCLCLWGIGNAIGVDRAGRWAGFFFALAPSAVWNASSTVWDTTSVAFGIALFVFLLLRFGRSGSIARWAGLGALFGALLLVNPAPMSLGVVALWFLAAHRPDRRSAVRAGVAFTAAAFFVCLPWLIRNQRAVGAFNLRTNLGVEMDVGNNDLAQGYPVMSRHPSSNADEFRRYREMGEVPYAALDMRRAKDWIWAHPARFALLTLHRIQLVWFGEPPTTDPREEPGVVAARDAKSWIKWIAHLAGGVLGLYGAWRLARVQRDGRYLLAILLLFPAPYYLTHTLERYRFPIEPLIVFMVAWLAQRGYDRWNTRQR
jgi:4-amino-4-deoxy-L-arabinose transferase-like glycosyltransferase